MSFTIFYNQKNSFLGYKNKKFRKSKFSHFSKGVNPWFWSKNGHFFNLFFLGNIGQENVFYDILQQKNSFLVFKKKKLKKLKYLHFYKSVFLMVFVQKWPLFQPVYLGNRGKENVFHDILAQKKNLSRL